MVVCVCVNEVAHYQVLEAIAEVSPGTRLVLCEKPLTETLEQFVGVERLFRPEAVTVNFVERYSPIVSDFVAWREKESAAIFRGEFWWGKYRFRDLRPTMGVLSEISHPIDLVRALAGLPESIPFDVRHVDLSASDFSCREAQVADSVDVHYALGSGLLVRGHSSFLWEDRMRRIVLYARDGDGPTVYQAVLSFDSPRWDQDVLTIYRLDGNDGARSIELETRYTNSDFPEELDQVFKVTRYVHESLRLLTEPTAVEQLVTVGGARWVQQAIEDIGTRAAASPTPPLEFGARR